MFARPTARTSLFALSALVLSNTAGCFLGEPTPEVSHLDARSPEDREPSRDEKSADPGPSGLPDEEPLPGMPGPASTDDEKTPVDPAARACDLAKPFGALEPLPFDTSAYETGGRLSADELTFYFSRKGGPGNMQPYVATRAAKNEAWGAATVIGSVDSSADDGYFTTTKDELVGFFASSRSGNLQIHKTSRAARSDAWGAIAIVTSLGSTSVEDDPFLVANGRAIYFDSNRSGTWTVYRAAIDAQGKVGAPAVVTTGMNAVVTGDELTMYFSRADGAQTDVLVSTRAKATDAWGEPALVSELSSTGNDRVTWISEDGCRAIVSSTCAGGAGSSDLYFVSKPK